MEEEVKEEEAHSNSDGGVGHIEGGPMEILPMEIQEVDDFSEADPIDEVTHGSSQDKGQGHGIDSTFPFTFNPEGYEASHGHRGEDDQKAHHEGRSG